MSASLRFPAEWEPQSGVLIAWPHAGTDWADGLADVERTYVELAAAIARFERVVVCVADVEVGRRAAAMLSGAGHIAFRALLVERVEPQHRLVVGALLQVHDVLCGFLEIGLQVGPRCVPRV